MNGQLDIISSSYGNIMYNGILDCFSDNDDYTTTTTNDNNIYPSVIRKIPSRHRLIKNVCIPL